MDGNTFLEKVRRLEGVQLGEGPFIHLPQGDLGQVLADSLEPMLRGAPVVPYAIQLRVSADKKWVAYIVMPCFLIEVECSRKEEGAITHASLKLFLYNQIKHVSSFMNVRTLDDEEWGGFGIEFHDSRLQFEFGGDGPLTTASGKAFFASLMREYSSFVPNRMNQ